jgi:hypothetical protein
MGRFDEITEVRYYQTYNLFISWTIRTADYTIMYFEGHFWSTNDTTHQKNYIRINLKILRIMGNPWLRSRPWMKRNQHNRLKAFSVSRPFLVHGTFFDKKKYLVATLQWVNSYFEAPMRIIIDKSHQEYHQMPRKFLFWRHL